MAYGVKYRFVFDSVQGNPFRIDISKNNYSGSILYRAVGGSPVLRRDKSGSICGTSLEILAECAVDNEYEEFKTSVPFTFKVELYGGGDYSILIWVGYITPELMDAPDIAPPYDVQVSCTDGLGELKYADFPKRGADTLANHLSYLLSQTNLSLSVELVNDIYHGSNTGAQLLTSTIVNFDYMAGETCYDVLQYILESFHMTITQYHGWWLLFRETGATIGTRDGVPVISNAYLGGSTTATPIVIWQYGQMSTHSDGWWPVGHMSHRNEPPRKRIVLTDENHYPSNLLSDSVWVAVDGGVDSGDYWTLAAAGDGMRQSHSFSAPISQKLLLSIKVRNVGSGGDAGKLSVKVKAEGTSYAGSQTYYLVNGTYSRRNTKTDYAWSNSEADSVIDVQAPAPTDTDDDYVSIDVVLPIYRNDSRDYFYAESLQITISNSDGTYPQRVYGVTLSKYEQFKGMQKIVDIDNGARGDASDVGLCIAAIVGGNNYVGTEDLMYGVPMNTSYAKVSTWSSSAFSSLDFLSLMARDYALSIAAARTRERGVLNVPSDHTVIPVAFMDDHDFEVYFVESFSWRLYDDEMDVDMISLPLSTVTVADEELVQTAAENATNYSQAESSGGGGGGGGGGGSVTSVGVSVPTGMTVSGSPVTSSGTIAIGLATGNSIHGHSNKTVLDGITSTKVSNWDAAYGWGDHSQAGYLTSHQTIYKLTLSAGSFSAKTYTPNSAAQTVNVPTTLDHISDGSSRKLSDYVTLGTTQTITGAKTISTNPLTVDSTSGVKVNGSSYIEIGDARLEYDSGSKALRITKKSGSTQTIGLYADGFVSAGGVAASSTRDIVFTDGNQTIGGQKTFTGAMSLSSTLGVNGVTLTGSSTKLAVSKNTEFSGISNVTGGKISIQDLLDRIIALENIVNG